MGDVMPARGLVGCVPGLASRALTPQIVCGLLDVCALVGVLHAPTLPACGLGRGLRTTPGAVSFARVLGVTARSLLAAAGPAVIVRDHAVRGTSPVAVRGHGTVLSSPLTGLSHGRGVGDLGRVAGIVWRLMLPPRIAATLGRGWGLLLRLRAAPYHGSSLLCETSPGCSSVCRGPANSGRWLRALHFWLPPSPVLGRCLDPLHRSQLQPPLRVRLSECPLRVWSLPQVVTAIGSSGQQERSRESPPL